MTEAQAILLATLETKDAEADFLKQQLAVYGVNAKILDVSLWSDGQVLSGPEKLAAMDKASQRALDYVGKLDPQQLKVMIAIGGGTGAEISLRVMTQMPAMLPKVLLTTLSFDPRPIIADTSIIVIPTLADVCGLNPIICAVLKNAAAATAGLYKLTSSTIDSNPVKTVALTALGATEAAASRLMSALDMQGQKVTVFHSNGYGGAAFSRFALEGEFSAIIDLTPHEITRLHLAGVHASMPDRFSAGHAKPRIVLPGAINFLGLGKLSTLSKEYLSRPHYAHSGFFTHVKLETEEMEVVAEALIESLNTATGPRALIVPLGGFSHQDCVGGAIEDPDLRRTFLNRAEKLLNSDVQLIVQDQHISARETTKTIIETLVSFGFPLKGQTP
ncbi:hypothetical protein PsAD2_00919 [Pseudovibrio axinellae]|uniref:Uncharacterized protein n=1 Tax=Pseudovibrio axinellae TaxID=989403 RepID=A0A166ADJ2_9HYPH|nr:Tm-1-like ATP-binding domain-containing protein [Pseudovibrio axinellae]KZL20927.1 hypothetical protein PsAD2_00919 [Pseudovibrio axinellae]SEP82721.1 Uncharacterized protein, UPF0261 family [Pseudovibrio axinellae]